MAKQRQPFVTGDKELDMILRTFPDNEIRKAVRNASRTTIRQYVLPEYVRRVKELGFVQTGATRDIGKVKAVRRSKQRYGTKLTIPHDAVIDLRRQRGGRIGYDKKRKADFFHPIAIEAGVREGEAPPRALFKSLKANVATTMAEFRKNLRIALGQVAIRAKASMDNAARKAAAAASGATVYRDIAGRFQYVAGGFASRASAETARAGGTLFEGQ